LKASTAQWAGPTLGGRSRHGPLRWIALALAVFVRGAAAGCSGWLIAGGDPLAADLPEWLTVSTDSATVGATNRASVQALSRTDLAA